MKLNKIRFEFEDVAVIWVFDLSIAPDYRVNIINNVSGLNTKQFKTSKQPTVNNARKFAEE